MFWKYVANLQDKNHAEFSEHLFIRTPLEGCFWSFDVNKYSPVNHKTWEIFCSTLSWQRPLSYRNQSLDLPCKSMDWFLYDNGLRNERVKCERLCRKLEFVHIYQRNPYPIRSQCTLPLPPDNIGRFSHVFRG